ncbi:MAG: hypothetical protein J2P15_04630 [Micromonosporaceae bacterium]|nr:hypothetical protein [Micromonosporaceae bacterium]
MVLHLSGGDFTAGWSRYNLASVQDQNPGGGRTYYISPDGNDSQDGRSPGRPWRSLRWLYGLALRPGDRVLLQGGAQYPGFIVLRPGEAGDPAHPVEIGSYGVGRATLIPPRGVSGITVHNTAGVWIHDLAIIGNPVAYRSQAGIKLYSNLPGGRKLSGATINDVDVSGFHNGVEIGGGNGSTGFRDVLVSDSRLYGNRDNGLVSFGPAVHPARPAYAHQHLTVSNVEAFGNLGDPTNHFTSSGNGIVLASVDGGVVRHSVAYDNGARCTAPSGPVGIWSFDSAHVTIEHNVSYNNRTGGHADGGGFDLDRNVVASYLQYNLAYGNDGPGFMLYSPVTGSAHEGNVVRFNISQNDAGKGSYYGGITIGGRVTRSFVYHNTVVVRGRGTAQPAAIVLFGTLDRVVVWNNIFIAVGTPLIDSHLAFRLSQVALRGNDLYATAGQWQARWGPSVYSGLDQWRSAAGQEPGSGVRSIDPGFVYPQAQRGDGVWLALGFVPRRRSPLVGAGVNLRAAGVDLGTLDYLGTPLAGRLTVGAVQPTGA